MQFSAFIKRLWWGGIAFILSLLFPTIALALENPHLYYDWNRYYQPQEQVLGIQAFAQEGATPSAESTDTSTAPDHHDYKQYNGYILGLGNVNPDNPLYLFKKMQEGIVTTFTFDAKAREWARLQIAGERLSEMEAMVKAGKAGQITSLANNYDSTMETIANNLGDLKEKKQDVTGLLANTDIESAKHTLVLEEVSLQVPPQADQGIQRAIEASEHAVDTIADIVGRPAVPQEMIARLQSLKAQGLLTPEEVEKLTSVESRVSAREEFRKLAEARVFPEADFRKLDEAARSYFPQGYANSIEIRKFKELKELETAKPDDTTLKQLQNFADNYKAGDIVPSEIRRWWVPMIRLEELQNTIRPDLIGGNSFRYRPEEQQKYNELVERVKPRQQDIDYVNRLVQINPDILGDPAYARIKAIGDRFGAADSTAIQVQLPPQAQSCGRDAHWVLVGFMPNGGYCVPNLVYSPITGGDNQGATLSPCPPGYHRNDPQGACYPDNQYGPGIGGGPNIIGAPVGVNSCPAGYHRASAGPASYCAPDSPTIGGGPFPGPMPIPSYCPSGQMFRDGKCETYNPPPKEGCPQGQYWTGSKCTEVKNCGAGYYQDSGGECKKSDYNYPQPTVCLPPAGGCGFNAYYDYAQCGCKSTFDYPRPSGPVPTGDYPQPTGGPYPTGGGGNYCQPPAGGCGSGYFDNNSCSCKAASAQGCYNVSASSCGSGFYWDSSACTCRSNTPTGGGSTSCGSGYYWNGSYCAQSGGSTSGGGSTYPQPNTDPATACTQGTGCSWNGSSCQCTSTQTQQQQQPQPTQPPQQTQEQQQTQTQTTTQTQTQTQPESPPPPAPTGQ